MAPIFLVLMCSALYMVVALQLRSQEIQKHDQSHATIIDKIRDFMGIAAQEKKSSFSDGMALSLITQLHMQGELESSRIAKIEIPVKSPEAPVATATSWLRKKIYIARNCNATNPIFTYGESVGINVCYPLYTNLTAFNKFTVSGSVVTYNTYGSGGCSGTPVSTSTYQTGCDNNNFFSLAVTTSQGWGNHSGFGVNVYATTSACNKNSGNFAGSVFISTSPTGCYSSSNGTSDGISCSAGMIDFLHYPSGEQCTGNYQTTVVPKNDMCSTPGIYGYAYGYGYYKCFNL